MQVLSPEREHRVKRLKRMRKDTLITVLENLYLDTSKAYQIGHLDHLRRDDLISEILAVEFPPAPPRVTIALI